MSNGKELRGGVIDVVCAVIWREGRVLVCQRAAGKHLAGWWEFPGGKVDEGEGKKEALVREIREELGCGVSVGKGLEAVEHEYAEVAIRLWPFFCELGEGEPEALEHAGLRWVEPGELGGVELAPADVRVGEMIAD